MKMVYLDNAATTKIDDEVLATMYVSLKDVYGNPSSTHQMGRKAKNDIESARKNIAKYINAKSSELIFTSSGTEANNLILFNAVQNIGIQRIITSQIEHHAVLNPCLELEKKYNITLEFVKIKVDGSVDLDDLETLLATSNQKTLVSLMMINNEIGTLLPIKKVTDVCKKYNAIFHSDTVQVIGHYPLDVIDLCIDFLTASAHKLHGPKGVGFAYINQKFTVKPIIFGGKQEKGARSSTENVTGIIGFAKAIEIAHQNLEKDKNYIESLKLYCIEELKKISDQILFNANCDYFATSSYTILNVQLPTKNQMLPFQLDMAGIAISQGSACQSGANKKSHVLESILSKEALENMSIRISFSKYNTTDDVDFLVQKLKELLK